MNLFWQITAVEALLNVAIFAVAVIAYGFVRSRTIDRSWSRSQEQTAVGTLFGGATALAFLVPLHLDGGATVGCQAVLIALAGPISGDLAVMIALTLASAAAWQISGTIGHGGAATAFSALAAAALAGIILPYAMKWLPGTTTGFRYRQLPVLSLLSSSGALIGLAIVAGPAAAQDSTLAAIASGLIATLVLGTLLLHEKRRHDAEIDLKNTALNLKQVNERLLAQTADLIAARDAAEQSSRAKSAFLAGMSHELRTPLNAVIGFAQLIRAQTGAPHAKSVDYAGDIQSGGEHLLGLINDILDFSKSEAAKLEIEDEGVSINGEISACLRMMGPQAVRAGVTIDYAPPTAHYEIRGDSRRIRQIIFNLLSNAVKFTGPGGTVGIGLKLLENGDIELDVEDNGIGISEDDRERVFEPFYQVEDHLARSQQGTGLGLPLTKRLIELHDGHLRLESELGKGTIARAIFPARRIRIGALPTATRQEHACID
jgi:signal transduction histidine kinase